MCSADVTADMCFDDAAGAQAGQQCTWESSSELRACGRWCMAVNTACISPARAAVGVAQQRLRLHAGVREELARDAQQRLRAGLHKPSMLSAAHPVPRWTSS